ncbi:MAG: DMT family transporter [candidate division Zixibacteria bacterium]|nr:DMT family transporter [candidate division Zixibacteria bacterium]
MSNESIISKRPLWFLYAMVLLHQILGSLAFPFAKIGLNEIDPFVYAFFRFGLSTVVLLPILYLLHRKQKIIWKDRLKIIGAGLIIIPFNQVLFLIGQSKTSASHSSLLFATIPIFLYVLAIVFLKEKATIRRTIGIIIATGGVFIILSGGKIEFGGEYLIGDLLILIAVLAWAVGTIILKPMAVKYGAFRVTGLALIYGSLVYFPYGFNRTINYPLASISINGWLSIVYMAVFVSIIAYFLWYWTLKYMEASRVAVLHNIQPIIATIVAALILGEIISGTFILGGCIALAGVILTEI